MSHRRICEPAGRCLPEPPRVHQHGHVRFTLVALALVAGVATCACTAEDEPVADSGCRASVRDASFATEVEEQIRLLDTALVRCRSYDTLIDEMQRYPRIVGFELATFVGLRCAATDDEAIKQAPACAGFSAADVTVAATVPDLVFVGETLDGRTIEIRPDEDTRFIGDYPEVVQRTVDIATEAGCEAVLEQRDLWAARVDEPGFGDEASVYANHAQNVAQFIGCDVAPLATAATTPTTAT